MEDLSNFYLYDVQRVYQLLPPPYRDVWLEWQDAEDKVRDEVKLQENKVSKGQITGKLGQLISTVCMG
jgi:ATP-dependent RNA helicase DHX29